MFHSLWQGDFTRNRKQAQGPLGSVHTIVSSWNEVPPRGGVRGDVGKKNYLHLHRRHLSVTAEPTGAFS